MKIFKSTSEREEKKFFDTLFRALFKNSWGMLHPNLRFDNIYLRELLDILHKELDEIALLKHKGLGLEKDLHYFLGTNRFSFWCGVRTALSHLLIGLDEKQETVGMHSNREDVLHILNIFKTDVKTGQVKKEDASVQYVAKLVERILDNKERLDAVRLIKILNITKRGGQSALPVKPTKVINSLMSDWAEDIIDCLPGEKTNIAKLIERAQEKEYAIGEEETNSKTYREWWDRYKWFALNTYLFNKTLFAEKKNDIDEKQGIRSLLPSVIASGSLNETQIHNIKKTWKIDVKPDLVLFYGGADWWNDYPELDKDIMTELAWVGYAREKN